MNSSTDKAKGKEPERRGPMYEEKPHERKPSPFTDTPRKGDKPADK